MENEFGFFTQLLMAIGAIIFLWILIRTVKTNPNMFSKENLSKSFSTMGGLALILIAFVSFMVLLLKYT